LRITQFNSRIKEEGVMKKHLRLLANDKVKINWNKNPITMELFLSFLTVPVERQTEFLGSSNGWTKLTGENGLDITGGIIKGVEYLDRILYGKNLDNPYNNYVNPFYIFEIMNEEGKAFFVDYFREDIQAILKARDSEARTAVENRDETFEFWKRYGIEFNEATQ
jgi:hypothetical protein